MVMVAPSSEKGPYTMFTFLFGQQTQMTIVIIMAAEEEVRNKVHRWMVWLNKHFHSGDRCEVTSRA